MKEKPQYIAVGTVEIIIETSAKHCWVNPVPIYKIARIRRCTMLSTVFFKCRQSEGAGGGSMCVCV